LVVAENGTPSLEVSFRSDGHPPFIKRERENSPERHQWGKILGMPESIFDSGIFLRARDLKNCR
jgi:hypothetical protein